MKALLIFLLLSAPALAQVEYHVNTKAGNKVTFISDAPVEDFEGVTDNIDGYLTHGADGVTDDSKLYFEVDLRTLDTGIGLRNRHMRENYLHTDKYPYAKFSGRVTSAKQQGSSTAVVVRGNMDIHGVKKPMQVSGTLHPADGGLRIKTDFEVKLTDHGIEVPEFMFLKIDETMQLVVDFTLKKVKG